MLADHLTEVEPSQLASSVLAVLAGADLHTVATDHGLEPAELSEAVQMYMAAGYAALERRTERRWNQVLIEFHDWEQAETVAATHLGPRLNELQTHGAFVGWWFLRKYPCWRLRLRSPGARAHVSTGAPEQLTSTLTELAHAQLIRCWRTSVYEPEYAAFGGSTALEIVHDLFCADSRGALEYAQDELPDIGRRELSIIVLHALLRSAGLDWFESGDVFHRVSRLRPPPPNPPSSDASGALAESVRTLLHVAAQAATPMLNLNGSIESATRWRDAFYSAGRQLGATAADGRLDRGLRSVLTHVVIFHWNRLGLSATTQGALARAAAAAYLSPA